MMAIYGYARVSTLGQDLKEQTAKLNDKGASKVFADKFSGKTADRPALKELLDVVKRNDRVVVTKLDRLARSAKDGLDLIDTLNEKGVSIDIIEQGMTFTGVSSPMQDMMRTMLLAFAEFERAQIVERTQAGKAYKKANDPNFKEGRPTRKITPRYQHALDLAESGMTVKEVSKKVGISERTIYRIKKQIEDEKSLLE